MPSLPPVPSILRLHRPRPGGGRVRAWAAVLALAWLLGAAVPSAARLAFAAEAPGDFRQVAVPGGPAQVHDGDTFDADLDGDGRLALPRERVRLLWVDTPELGEDARKGRDLAHGLPARDFLARLLERRPLVLYVPRNRPTGSYGRTLARVEAGGTRVNLALIRAGHSYFDTRFSFPADYAAYAAAEAEAFGAQRGIWADAESRGRYLVRLRKELKTPASPANPHYEPLPQQARTFWPGALIDIYIHLTGTVTAQRTLGKGVRRIGLDRGADRPPFPVIAFRRYAERLGVDGWTPGTKVRVEGFVQTYRGDLQLVLHYGEAVP